jgi:hypothetical protein
VSEEKKAEKTQAQILSDAFEGMKGRKPKSDQELSEWLATDEGKQATMGRNRTCLNERICRRCDAWHWDALCRSFPGTMRRTVRQRVDGSFTGHPSAMDLGPFAARPPGSLKVQCM